MNYGAAGEGSRTGKGFPSTFVVVCVCVCFFLFLFFYFFFFLKLPTGASAGHAPPSAASQATQKENSAHRFND